MDVASLEDARQAMLDPDWKKRSGRAYNRAVAAVLEAASGLEEAEAAFVAAAKDAGMLRE